MRIGLGIWAWIALAWVAAEGWLLAQPVRRGPPIQFSEPQSDLLLTNIHRLPRGDQARPNLTEEMQRRPSPFQELGDPLRPGVLPRPPAGPMIQNPRVRELLERQRLRDGQSAADPLSSLSGLEGERRLGRNLLEEQGPGPEGTGEMDPRLGTRLGGGWENEGLSWPLDNASAEESGMERGTAGRQKSAEAAASEARVEQWEKAFRQEIEGRGVLQQLPGLERSFWDGPMTSQESALSRAQARAREARLEQFRAGLEAVVASPAGGLDPARSTLAGETARNSGRSLVLPAVPLWRETPPASVGAVDVSGRSLVSSPMGTLSGEASGRVGGMTGGGVGAGSGAGALGGAVSSPAGRSSAAPAARGPKMPSPFTEIPKRPGI